MLNKRLSLLVALLLIVGMLAACASSNGNSIPLASSSLVKNFLWQTDGLYGYRMLRPASWQPIDMKDRRGYQPPGLAGQPDQVLLMAFNLQVVAKTTESPTSMIAQWGVFERDHSLGGWTAGIEQLWANTGTEFTLVRTLPQAKIYLLKPTADSIWLAAYAVDKDQPLTIGLEAHGVYADEVRLQRGPARRFRDDGRQHQRHPAGPEEYRSRFEKLAFWNIEVCHASSTNISASCRTDHAWRVDRLRGSA